MLKFLRRSLCVMESFVLLLVFPLDTNSFLEEGLSFFWNVTNHNSMGTNIICLGDSLTVGTGASPGHDYPSLLGKALGVNVINAGVDGDETKDALKRLDQDVLSKDPRLVIILLGANDYLNERPLEKVFTNLDEIIRQIQDRGAMVLLAEIGNTILGKDLQERYDQLVARRRIAFVPLLYKDILFNPSLKSDHLHPNDRGYEVITERILQVVKSLIRKSSFRT